METFGLRIILLTSVIAVLVLSLIGGRKVLSKAEGPGGNALFVYELFKIADAEELFKTGGRISIGALVFMKLFDCSITGRLIVFILWILIFWWIHALFCRKLATAFGKRKNFAYGLTFLYPVFITILGFGSAEYLGPLFFPVTEEMDWSQDKKGGDIK